MHLIYLKLVSVVAGGKITARSRFEPRAIVTLAGRSYQSSELSGPTYPVPITFFPPFPYPSNQKFHTRLLINHSWVILLGANVLGGKITARPAVVPRTFLTLAGRSYQLSYPGRHTRFPLHKNVIVVEQRYTIATARGCQQNQTIVENDHFV